MTGEPFYPDKQNTTDADFQAAISLGRTEAETLEIGAGFRVSRNPHGSGQAYLDAGTGPASAGGRFEGSAGIYDLTIGYFDERDGISEMEVLVNGVRVSSFAWDGQQGAQIVTSEGAATHVVPGLALAPGDLIELRGTPSGGEPLRTDYLDVTASTAPIAGSGFVVEAESLALISGVVLFGDGAASGRLVAQHDGDAAPARLGYTVEQSGTFDVTIGYFDETDGVSTLTVLLNGTEIAAFDWDGTEGTELASRGSAAEYLLAGLTLTEGDSLELQAYGDCGEPARIDYLSFVPAEARQDEDIPGDASTQASVEVDSEVVGQLEVKGDRDWFAIDLEAGRAYRFELTGDVSAPAPLNDPYFRLYDATGVLIGENNDFWDLGSRLDYIAVEDVRVYASAGAFGDTEAGGYLLSVSDLAREDGVPAGTGTSEEIAPGEVLPGTVNYAGDQDWFAITLEAGMVYSFSLAMDANSSMPLYESWLRLYGASGGLLAEAMGDFETATITYVAEDDEILFLAASGFYPDDVYNVGSYWLSAEEVGPAAGDLPADSSTGAQIEVGGETGGTLDYQGDEDWFGVDLVGGETYRFTLLADVAAETPLYDGYLQLFDAAGGWLKEAWNYVGEGRSLSYTAAVDERVYVSASASGWTGSEVGDYLITAERVDLGEDSIPADSSTTAQIAPGEDLTGWLEYSGDRDWYAVDLEAGHGYRFWLIGDYGAIERISTPYLRLHDAEGELLALDQGFLYQDTYLHYTATEDETAYISVSEFGDVGTGAYLLLMTDMTVEDTISEGTDTLGEIAAGDQLSSRIDYEFDSDWFAIDVKAGQTYLVELAPEPGASFPLHDGYIGLHDADGNYLGDTYWAPPEMLITAETDERLFISVQGTEYYHFGDYVLTAADVTGQNLDFM